MPPFTPRRPSSSTQFGYTVAIEGSVVAVLDSLTGSAVLRIFDCSVPGCTWISTVDTAVLSMLL